MLVEFHKRSVDRKLRSVSARFEDATAKFSLGPQVTRAEGGGGVGWRGGRSSV